MVVFAVVLLLTLSISSDSLWIDELTTAWLAQAESLSELWQRLLRTGSEMQMPLFVLAQWGWAQLLGSSELALRALNVLWAVVFTGAMAVLFRVWRVKPVALLLCLMPMMVFYMNEARPYLMSAAGAALALAGLELVLFAPSRAGRVFLVTGLVICLGASMLNVCLLPALLVYAVMRMWTTSTLPAAPRLLRRERGGVASGGLVVAGFGLFYVWTVQRGHGGQFAPFTVQNFGFAVYEWLGFSGLGPARYEFQGRGPAALQGAFAGVAAGAVIWALALAAAWRTRAHRDPLLQACCAGLVAGGFFLVAAAVMARASIWGRHFMALAPLVAGALGLALCSSGMPQSRQAKVAGGMLLLLLLLSSLHLRVGERYRKDPYRAAAQVAQEQLYARPSPLVWVGAPLSLQYYSIPHAGTVLFGNGFAARDVAAWTQQHPRFLLMLHRPDKFDVSGAWRALLTDAMNVEPLWQMRGMALYRIAKIDSPVDLWQDASGEKEITP